MYYRQDIVHVHFAEMGVPGLRKVSPNTDHPAFLPLTVKSKE